MSEIKDGGPAFPGVTGPGISKREWYAGMAIQGLASQDGWYFGTVAKPHDPWPDVAKTAFQIADAMILAGKVEK